MLVDAAAGDTVTDSAVFIGSDGWDLTVVDIGVENINWLVTADDGIVLLINVWVVGVAGDARVGGFDEAGTGVTVVFPGELPERGVGGTVAKGGTMAGGP